MTTFKLIGLIISANIILLSIFWSKDPDAGSLLLFLGGMAVLIGIHRIVINKEQTKYERVYYEKLRNPKKNR